MNKPKTTNYEIAPTMRVPENHWYPVLESCEIGHKPLGVERLGRDWCSGAPPRVIRMRISIGVPILEQP